MHVEWKKKWAAAGLVAVVAVVAAVAVGRASLGGAPGAGVDDSALPVESHQLSGFPLDRSFEALIKDQDAQTIVLIASADPRAAVDVTPEKDAGGSAPLTIVTPVEGRVVQVLKGTWTESSLILPVMGGQVGNVRVEATQEIAPLLSDVTSQSGQLLLAGTVRTDPRLGGEYLDPSFVYSVDESGIATSLLKSAGPVTYPKFKLSVLTNALNGRTVRR